MSGLRGLAREVAHSQSYRRSHTTDMFGYFFQKNWRDKGHPASGIPSWRACKKKKRK